MHFTSIASVATASINCASFALSLALFQLALQLHLYMLSTRIDYLSYSVRQVCLDRILRSAARLIGQIPKFSMCQTGDALLGLAPTYLLDLCRPVLGTRSTRSRCSAGKGVLSIPFARTSIMQSRASSVVGPSVWIGLPLELRLLPRSLSDTFYRRLKTVLFLPCWSREHL